MALLVPPPVLQLPWGTTADGRPVTLTSSALQFLQQLWTIGGSGGAINWGSITGIPPVIEALGELGFGADGTVLTSESAAPTGLAWTAGSGGGGNEPILLSAFGPIDPGGVNTANNNAAFAAAELAPDSAIYITDGVYATSQAENTFSKNYQGRGVILFPTSGNDAYPAKYSYMATIYSAWPTQGRSGWFRGDQRFTDQEYRVIGPGVRTYNLTGVGGRYYESNTIPHNAWMDIFSGNSGAQAYMNSGATAGSSLITLNAAADASWVGKTVGFALGYGTGPLETHTILAVNTAGNNISISGTLANTYVWNPGAGSFPTITFAPSRTWGGYDYILMRCTGGGDFYGSNVRSQSSYVPFTTELIHPFLASTVSQYGGDVTALTSGNYLQSWESQIQGGTFDNTAVSFVQSMVRNVDFIRQQGRFWAFNFYASSGTRPSDVGMRLAGNFRNGFDSAGNTNFYETTYNTATINNGDATITCDWVNGAHPGDPINIGEPGAILYSGVIVSVSGLVVTVTPAYSGSPVAANTLVSFNHGGAAINLAIAQRIIFNSTINATGRSSDATGVFSTFYGNQQGDCIMEGGTDGVGDLWQVRFADGGSATVPDSARIRVRRGGSITLFVNGGPVNINAASLSLVPGANFNMDTTSGGKLTIGSGIWMEVQGGIGVITNDAGVTFHPL